ncbi:pullulanase [Streptococcus halichoeri]|uniref:pullulanase n=1 Tax=Streptococcus halichoeri TaxID=254785 RepID=UPI001356ACB8|nr:pullulanase [Streptococcus halichoeri]
MTKHSWPGKASHLRQEHSRYAIKKLSIGVTSVAIGAAWLGISKPVLAQETKADNQPVALDLTANSQALTEDHFTNQSDYASDGTATAKQTLADSSASPASTSLTPPNEAQAKKEITDNRPQAKTTTTLESTAHSPNKPDINIKVPAETEQAPLPAPNATAEGVVTAPKIEPGYFRLHLQTLPNQPLDNLGLWLWDDVERASDGWPLGATPLAQAQKDDFGYYLDIKMSKSSHQQLSFLINNHQGDNISQNRHIALIDPQMNEAWVDSAYKIFTYRPVPKGYVRINYRHSTDNYDHLAAWVFKDVSNPSQDWPTGACDFVKEGPYGKYVDIPLKENAKELGFLILDKSKKGDDVKIQPNDYLFKDLANHNQVFVKDTDPKVYNNPYYVDQVVVKNAEQTSLTTIKARFSTLDGVDETQLRKEIKVTDKAGQPVEVTALSLDPLHAILTLSGNFKAESANYTVSYGKSKATTYLAWELKDQLYAYDGELGAKLNETGTAVDLRLWSPSADAVKVVVYDKTNQDLVLAQVAMTKAQAGVWQAHLDHTSLPISNYDGYYYHYAITRGNQTVLVLDPYAKSLAAWDSNHITEQDKVAKAAFVNPSQLGPKLDFAKIDGFEKREDAIIYEANIRDFTSDLALEGQLKQPFGTFLAFTEKLDYLKNLGVTHIQLMPIMSYFFVNENDKSRSNDYSSADNNYNWGYDPQSYFALTGMYATDPTNPSLRITEFKNLVNEIHKRGMGVILDVVYNHTARTYIFEDLEPNYYHFMNADGSPRESFGGGRLGTTHAMSRRVLVDSITYFINEFKVDGFRFDMMGDHDAAAIEKAFQIAKTLNPNIIMIGEGWRTFQGDENKKVTAADQDWMATTDTVGVFSDDIRNALKSGYPNEGTPAFITGSPKNLELIFNNIKAQPTNFKADSPGDVVQYIAAHDNLTLHDVIAKSINKDPQLAHEEIHKRIRLGNTLILTAQGTAFLHSGQEYGRTKQLLNPNFKGRVSQEQAPNKSTVIDAVSDFPYFIHDSYDSSDAVNHFDWTRATDTSKYPISTKTQAYTAGLIALRRSTDAFRKASKSQIDQEVTLITQAGHHGIKEEDLVIGYQTIATNGDRYAVFVNADQEPRRLILPQIYQQLLQGEVLVDAEQAGTSPISQPIGITFTKDSLTLAGLTAVVIRLAQAHQPSAADHQMPQEQDKAKQEDGPSPQTSTNQQGGTQTHFLPEARTSRESQNMLAKTGDSKSKTFLALVLALTGLTGLVISKWHKPKK